MRGAAVEGKAALVVKGDDILIEGLECSEINVVNGNGACIRMEGRNLTLRRVYFHDSQEGILVGWIGRAEKGRLLIEDSRFERLGFGGRAHAIYVGEGDITFEIRRSRVVASKGQGHEIKSRAARTLIEGCVIASLEGADSRLVDVPNGGEVVIRNNLFQKGPNSQNPDLIAVGLERGKPGRSDHAVNSILIEGNTFILERGHRMNLVHTKHVPPAVLRRNTIIGGLPYREGDNLWYRNLAAAGLDRPGALLPAVPERAPASVDELFNFVEQQLRRAVSEVWVSRRYPRSLRPGNSWHVVDAKDWTSGFFPGAMWLLYQATGKTLWRDWAKAWTAGLAAQRANTTTHDIGFIIGTSFGHGYRITSDAAYRQVIMTAARTLASRYSPTVGAIRSWDWGRWRYPVIIDNMMNLELLFEATRLGGPKAWRDIAIAHARRTMAEHMRADGSVYHLVDFDPVTGAVRTKGTYQGYSDESAWSRGQGGSAPDMESFFGQGRPRGSRPRRGANIKQNMVISFEEAALGTEKTIIIQRNGDREETKLKIPAGIQNGKKLRLSGKGYPGNRPDLYGDLYLVIRVEPHPIFRRKNNDIIVDCEIKLTDALLGANMEVPTLAGPKSLKIPPGTQSHSKLRMKGLGLPGDGGKKKGDQLVRVLVKYPQELTDEQIKLIQNLKDQGI